MTPVTETKEERVSWLDPVVKEELKFFLNDCFDSIESCHGSWVKEAADVCCIVHVDHAAWTVFLEVCKRDESLDADQRDRGRVVDH